MIWDVAMVVIASVLFNHLGMAEAVTFGTKDNVVINCTKCLTFWSTLAYMVTTHGMSVLAVFVPFTASYAALWIELSLNWLNFKYEAYYGKIHDDETDSTYKD